MKPRNRPGTPSERRIDLVNFQGVIRFWGWKILYVLYCTLYCIVLQCIVLVWYYKQLHFSCFINPLYLAQNFPKKIATNCLSFYNIIQVYLHNNYESGVSVHQSLGKKDKGRKKREQVSLYLDPIQTKLSAWCTL